MPVSKPKMNGRVILADVYIARFLGPKHSAFWGTRRVLCVLRANAELNLHPNTHLWQVIDMSSCN